MSNANFFSAQAVVKDKPRNNSNGSSNTTKRKYPAPKAGGHLARPVEVIFLGEQTVRGFGNKPDQDKQMVRVTFELVNSMIDRVVNEETGETEKQPHWVSREIPVSKSDKSTFIKWAMRIAPDAVQLLNEYSFTPKGSTDKVVVKEYDADYSQILGKPCQVFIQVDEWDDKATGEKRQAAKIKDVMEPMEGVPVTELKDSDKIRIFSPADPRPVSVATFNELPNWLQDKITGAKDWEQSPLKEAIDGGTQPTSSKVEEKQPTSSEPEIDEDIPFEADTDNDDPFDV